jgi:hypothetical protein
MLLPKFKRLVTTDFAQTYQSLVDKLAFILNSDIQNLYNVLNNQVSLKDNVYCTVATVQASTGPTGAITAPVVFQLNSQQNSLEGVIPINVTNITNPTNYPTGGVTLSYTQVQTGVQITNITGLPANSTMQMVVVAFG